MHGKRTRYFQTRGVNAPFKLRPNEYFFFRLMPCSAQLRVVIIAIGLMSLAIESLRIELNLFCLLQTRFCGRCGVGNFSGPVNNPLQQFIRSASSVTNFNESILHVIHAHDMCG